jgi:SpoVK/Ycf46/Vps4 family AAA+-type ATPase
MKETIELMLSDFVESEPDLSEDKVSMWVKDKDYYIPSTDISVTRELPPGIYQVDYSNDRGYFCKPIKIETDELFIFTDSITTNLLEEIENFWNKETLYKEKKLVHKRGILLSGFAGTGKTTMINMLSKELINRGGVVFKIYGIKNLSYYIDFMKHGFRKIQPKTPIITILEDIDQYQDIESELLDFLDGQYHLNHHLIIATSNNTENIPDTFLRPSRLDLKIEVDYPSEQTREEFFRNKEVPENDLSELVKATKECSLADLKEVYICVYLLDYTVEEALTQVLDPTEKKNYLERKYKKTKIGL